MVFLPTGEVAAKSPREPSWLRTLKNLPILSFGIPWLVHWHSREHWLPKACARKLCTFDIARKNGLRDWRGILPHRNRTTSYARLLTNKETAWESHIEISWRWSWKLVSLAQSPDRSEAPHWHKSKTEKYTFYEIDISESFFTNAASLA